MSNGANPEELLRKLVREELLQLMTGSGGAHSFSGHQQPQPQQQSNSEQQQSTIASLQTAFAAQQAAYAAQQALLQQHNGSGSAPSESPQSESNRGSNSSGQTKMSLERRLRSNLEQLKRVLRETEEIGKKLEQMLDQFPSKQSLGQRQQGQKQKQ